MRTLQALTRQVLTRQVLTRQVLTRQVLTRQVLTQRGQAPQRAMALSIQALRQRVAEYLTWTPRRLARLPKDRGGSSNSRDTTCTSVVKTAGVLEWLTCTIHC